MKILPNLTGLRFVLAFLVMIYHIPQFCQNRGFPFFDNLIVFNRGVEAVCMFFSLSGFLIIRQLFVEKSISNSINLRRFFAKRILRIYPLYYLVLSFGFLYYRFILPHFGLNYKNEYDLMQGILLSYTFFPNIFALQNPGGIIEVLWSIGIEEQFYILFSILIFILPFKQITRFIVFFTMTYFVLFFSESISLMKEYNMLFFYFSFSGIVSILLLNERFKLHQMRYLFIVVFLIYFTTSVFKDNLSDRSYNLFSMILFGLTIGSLAEKPIQLLDNKIFNFLGNISYGIYMYHYIIAQFIGFLFLKSNLHLKISSLYSIIIFNLLVIIFTVFTAHLSYKYFESYFLNMKSKFRSKVE